MSLAHGVWRVWRTATLAGALATLAACSTVPSAGETQKAAAPTDCDAWFHGLDQAVSAAGVTDAQEHRLVGHPWLRTSRFTAALAQDKDIDDATFANTVLPQMRALDRAARAAEISNLPTAALATWGLSREEVLERTERCAATSMQKTQLERHRVAVPDDYRPALRWWGAYPLTKHVFTAGIERELGRMRAAFAEPLTLAPGTRLIRYVAPPTSSSKSDADAALLDRHQPVFEKEVLTQDDLAGALVWLAPQALPVVQSERPTIYRAISHTRYRGHTLMQLVYTVWFGARPPSSPFDLLAGHLDGLVWRVTLGPQGQALVYDSIHPCGCYHYFFPTPRAVPLPAPEDEPEWMFAPQALPVVTAQDRIVLRVAARTHYLKRVSVLNAQEPLGEGAQRVSLQALSQEQLRVLPVLATLDSPVNGDTPTRSAYGPDGLVPGSQRPERWFFWPMGITSAGQMRQWGRHATAFVGKRHFDDAHLFERRFEFFLGDY
jgi:hypothetical protein